MTQLQRGFARSLSDRYTAALQEIQRLQDQILAMREAELPFPVRHPGRNQAVLACACGAMLNARDIVRIVVPHGGPDVESAPGISKVGCRDCAIEAKAAGRRDPRPHPNPPSWSA